MNRQALLRGRGLLLCVVPLLAAFSAHADDSIDKRSRKQGMDKAPALVKSLSLNCTVSDARALSQRTSVFAGSTLNSGFSGGDSAGGGAGGGGGSAPPASGGGGSSGGGFSGGPSPGGSSQSDAYEVACNEGLGYVIVAAKAKNQPAEVLNCLELAGPTTQSGPPPTTSGSRPAGGSPPGGGMQCLLPANANQVAALQAYVLKAGLLSCSLDKARGVGHTANATVFEIACEDGTGYLLASTTPPDPNKPVQYSSCLDVPENSSVQCQFTSVASLLTAVEPLMAKTGKSCQITGRRLLGRNDSGDKFFEVSCQEGTGYVVQQTSDGSLGQFVTCAELGATAGGCQLAGNKK